MNGAQALVNAGLGQRRPWSAPALVNAWAAVLVAVVCGASSARAGGLPVLVFCNHRFEPAGIELPARQRSELLVENGDDAADEIRERRSEAGKAGQAEPDDYRVPRAA